MDKKCDFAPVWKWQQNKSEFFQLSRLQNNLQDPDDSTVLTSMSYPNSAANGVSNGVPNNSNNRQSWSAPQDPFGFKGPNSIMNNQVKTGPGEGPTYGRAKMQAERTRIRQMAMNGSLSDPLEPVRGRRNSFSQPDNNEGYSPSMYNEQNSKRGNYPLLFQYNFCAPLERIKIAL